jgi:hypothetical protein
MQFANTTKLFYKKWSCKAECWNFSWIYAIITCNANRPYFPKVTKDSCIAFQNWVNWLIFNHEVQVRKEGGAFITFYFNDQSLLEKMSQAGPWVRKIFRPKNQQELQILLTTPQTIKLCNRYYQGKYKFKVYISSKISKLDRERFVKWIEQYPDRRVLLTGSTLDWFTGRRSYYLDSPYIYVLDNSTLTMVNMYLGNHIKKKEEYVLRSSINTLSTEPKEILNGSV